MVKFAIAAVVAALFIVGCSSANKTTTTQPAAESAQKSGKKDAKSSKSTQNASTSGSGVECKNGSDVRKLEILKSGSGCQLAYSKFGETSNIASAANGTEYCETVSKRIQGKLADAGFTCN